MTATDSRQSQVFGRFEVGRLSTNELGFATFETRTCDNSRDLSASATLQTGLPSLSMSICSVDLRSSFLAEQSARAGSLPDLSGGLSSMSLGGSMPGPGTVLTPPPSFAAGQGAELPPPPPVVSGERLGAPLGTDLDVTSLMGFSRHTVAGTPPFSSRAATDIMTTGLSRQALPVPTAPPPLLRSRLSSMAPTVAQVPLCPTSRTPRIVAPQKSMPLIRPLPADVKVWAKPASTTGVLVSGAFSVPRPRRATTLGEPVSAPVVMMTPRRPTTPAASVSVPVVAPSGLSTPRTTVSALPTSTSIASLGMLPPATSGTQTPTPGPSGTTTPRYAMNQGISRSTTSSRTVASAPVVQAVPVVAMTRQNARAQQAPLTTAPLLQSRRPSRYGAGHVVKLLPSSTVPGSSVSVPWITGSISIASCATDNANPLPSCSVSTEPAVTDWGDVSTIHAPSASHSVLTTVGANTEYTNRGTRPLSSDRLYRRSSSARRFVSTPFANGQEAHSSGCWSRSVDVPSRPLSARPVRGIVQGSGDAGGGGSFYVPAAVPLNKSASMLHVERGCGGPSGTNASSMMRSEGSRKMSTTSSAVVGSYVSARYIGDVADAAGGFPYRSQPIA
eukprot:TRINITY_DN13245_c0_g1_i1.p1 TRINITY_DN13245_c0_g1~~TRINITY_DN13245_c0_g1_i1.p1  ORF type:complete len:650 (-),score=75.64 TRINITY_DN13245_c0_g1_i1:172-2016(-)